MKNTERLTNTERSARQAINAEAAENGWTVTVSASDLDHVMVDYRRAAQLVRISSTQHATAVYVGYSSGACGDLMSPIRGPLGLVHAREISAELLNEPSPRRPHHDQRSHDR